METAESRLPDPRYMQLQFQLLKAELALRGALDQDGKGGDDQDGCEVDWKAVISAARREVDEGRDAEGRLV